MNPLETLTEALDAAQNELKSAEIGFLEALEENLKMFNIAVHNKII